MSMFRIYVDGALFYHPNLSKLAVTQAQVSEDAESIDSLTLSAPYNHPYLDSIRPMASVIVCKKDEDTVFEGRALDDGSDFYNTHTWTCESCLAYLKDTIQPPFSYKGPLKGLLEYFIRIHNEAVEEQKRFTIGNVTVKDDNDYISYSNSEYSVTMDAIKKSFWIPTEVICRSDTRTAARYWITWLILICVLCRPWNLARICWM